MGRGAGAAFLRWGMEQADMEDAEVTVESSLSAESFYVQHGFKRLEHVRIVPPPEYSDKAIQELVWMVRPARSLR